MDEHIAMAEHEGGPPWRAFCDGAALPERGIIGVGVVLWSPAGEHHAVSEAAGRGCNNEAEVRALLCALRAVRAHGGERVVVHTDSDVVMQHVMRGKVTQVTRLAPLFSQAKELLAGFSHAEVVLVPRRRNADADALARAALGLPRKPAR